MGWKKKIAVGSGATVLAAVVFVVGGGLLIEPNFDISTETELKASPEAAFRLVSSPAGVQAWWKDFHEELPEGQSSPPMEMPILEGPTEGPGSRIAFEADGHRWEEWKLLELSPPGKVVWEVDFQIMVTNRTLELVDNGQGGTKMSWSDRGKIQNPIFRWMTVLMPPDDVVANFQHAMKLLDKRALEQEAASSAAPSGAPDQSFESERAEDVPP